MRDGGRQRVATVRVGAPHPDDQGPTVAYSLGDHLGSSVAVLDGTGAVVNREEYTPYGETSLGGYARKRYRFTGSERDGESGLSYHGARYLAAHLGRWISTDPAGLVDGLNLYRYVRNNPVTLVDPAGTDPVTPLHAVTPEDLRRMGIDPGVLRNDDEHLSTRLGSMAPPLSPTSTGTRWSTRAWPMSGHRGSMSTTVWSASAPRLRTC